MKSLFFTIIFFLSIYSVHAQTPALKVVNQNTGKELIIKNKSRAKIKTSDGRKIIPIKLFNETKVLSISMI